MLRKVLLLMMVTLSLCGIVFAQEAPPNFLAMKWFMLTVQIATFSVIILGAAIILFIIKLKHNTQQILNSVRISVIITVGIDILLVIILKLVGAYSKVRCATGTSCIFGVIILQIVVTAPGILLITLFVYYLVKYLKNRK